MPDHGKMIRELTRKIRISKAYTDWVARNMGTSCIKCGSVDNLECHHIIDLYHVILGLWRIYGDEEDIFEHAVHYHESDMLEGVTTCSKCHKGLHPGRSMARTTYDPIAETWCVIPRILNIAFSQSTRRSPSSAGLVTLQTILGIGWNIMNGNVESRILTIHRRRFADLIGKSPGTSFNRSLESSLDFLVSRGILNAVYGIENEVEIHLSKEYLEAISANPWFVPLSGVITDSMCVLCLRLFLGMQSKRRTYLIGLDKLKPHIGMTISHKTKAIAAIQKALAQIPGIKMEVDSSLIFHIASRKPTPIRTLRAILDDSMRQAK